VNTRRNTILCGDAVAMLRTLPAASIDCVITSPPYFRLRDYEIAGQLGQETHVDQWVTRLRAITGELHRTLAPYGSLWLNLGDSYSAHPRYGAPAKSLLLAPERLARALVADGWLLRNKVIWAKSNPLPSPASDRLTNSHEIVYFLTKQPSYYFDLDLIREPARSHRAPSRGAATPARALGTLAGSRAGLVAMARQGRSAHPLGKNPGDVWRIGSSSYRGAHFATFPAELVRRPLLATCPERVCTRCRQPWRRSTRRVRFIADRPQRRPLVPCGCGSPTRPGLVLDPFFGTGTVAEVARAYGRDWLGIELKAEYVDLAKRRLSRRQVDACPVGGRTDASSCPPHQSSTTSQGGRA
jgi:site-specific DNA-methyltransferase (adenine-specific)